MNIRYFEKRPGAWHLDFRVGGHRYRPYGGSTQREAEANAAKVIAAALGPAAATVPTVGQLLPTVKQMAEGGMTLEQAYRKGLQVHPRWVQSKSKVTLQQTFDNLGVKPYLPCAALTRDFVRGLVQQWRQEPGKRAGSALSPSTINHRLSMLSVLLKVADCQPHGVEHLSVKGNRRTRRITDEEINRIGWWCHNTGRRGSKALHALVLLALDTCARQGELLGLEWRDVGKDAVTFRDTKNGETRTVPLTARAAGLLEARRGLPRPFSDTNAQQVKHLWSDMRIALGLATDEEFVFHALRHEGISRLVDKGVNPFVIQAIAGHSNITTTQVYAHASLGAMRQAITEGA